ncbi:uncharacterized protein LOC136752613 [Amia ocellicauda]|uniref:uncharacterized protein LOC136752613 n=1 Tax=Amia ocellicauda TaxID=2972642 RepID=UPI003464382E
MTSTDPETLQQPPRGRCLDRCLLGSVVCLFVLLAAAVCGGAVLLLRLKSADSSPVALRMVGHGSAAHYQNVAFLQPIVTDQIKKHTIQWEEEKSALGNSVGTHFKYDKDNGALTIKVDGMYFLSFDMALKCNAVCEKAATVTVTFQTGKEHVLECQVDIPKDSVSVPVKQCQAMRRLSKNDSLLAKMNVTVSELEWQLENDKSRFVIFLIDHLRT